MLVNFFEEYPTFKNLEKARLIDFPSKIYLGAPNIKKYYEHSKNLKRINNDLKTAYWPIPQRSLYIAPFSYAHDIESFISEIKRNEEELEVLIDLELPLTRKKLLITNAASFKKNKELIEGIFLNQKEYNIRISTAEYPPTSSAEQAILTMLGLSYDLSKYEHNRIIMLYSSFDKIRIFNKLKKKHAAKQARKYGEKFQVGLGTIATGILGNEPILTPKELREDLSFLTNNGINTTVIYRLGGLTRKYLSTIKEYAER